MIVAGDVTACVLAGGRARRMGGALKPLLRVDGHTILERQRAVLAPRVAEIVIAVAADGPLTNQGVRAVIDAVAGGGPLAGICSGFTASDRPWLLVVAGDMPSVAAGLIDLLLTVAVPTVDAVVPWIGGYPEPLLALYRRSAVPALARRLASGQRSVQAALDDLQVVALDEDAVRGVDPNLSSFRNLNYPDQL